MRTILFLTLFAAFLSSCEKDIKNPYEEQDVVSWSLYPFGDSAHYVANYWPTFTQNTNNLRNVLIEDFTGHKCIYCAPAGDTAHVLHLENPSRVLTTAIHAGPGNGSSPAQPGSLQSTDAEFTLVLYNQEGLELGQNFGFYGSGDFASNPSGNVSRINNSGQIFTSPSVWRSRVNNALSSTLKINLQSEVNYFSESNGVFLHTEIEVLDQLLNPNDLNTVVYLVQDSIIGKQKMPPPAPIEDNYIHRDVMRGVIGSDWKGKVLGSVIPEGGKYYFFYTYDLDEMTNEFGINADPNNFHFLIYVRDAITEEIYQVIKQDIQ